VEFPRSLTRRGFRSVKLLSADAHQGLKPAVTQVRRATAQRYRAHRMRNAPPDAGTSPRRIVAARMERRQVALQARPRLPRLTTLMDEAEGDELAGMTVPELHGQGCTAAIASNGSTERSSGAVT
jgi:transposase-like protein